MGRLWMIATLDSVSLLQIIAVVTVEVSEEVVVALVIVVALEAEEAASVIAEVALVIVAVLEAEAASVIVVVLEVAVVVLEAVSPTKLNLLIRATLYQAKTNQSSSDKLVLINTEFFFCSVS